MAVTATAQVLLDGPVNHHVLLTGSADGMGDLAPETAVDVSAMSPPAPKVKIMKAEYAISGDGFVTLYWDALAEEAFLHLSGQGCLEFPGGLHNASGGNGDVLIGTTGFDTGASFSVRLEMRKKY